MAQWVKALAAEPVELRLILEGENRRSSCSPTSVVVHMCPHENKYVNTIKCDTSKKPRARGGWDRGLSLVSLSF